MSKPIVKSLELEKSDYYSKHLSIVNVMLPTQLTPKEIEVLAAFMSLEGDIATDRFGTTARKMVMDQVGISSPGGLGNYLKSLKDKGFIKVEDSQWTILPLLHPHPQQQGYMFKLKRK